MTWKLIITLFNLLPVICAEYQEQKLISQLNQFYKFDHNIFLMDLSTDIDRFIYHPTQQMFTPQSVYVFKNVDGNIIGLETPRKIESKNVFLIVRPQSSSFESNVNLIIKGVARIQRLTMNMKIGYFFSEIASSDNLLAFFKFIWRRQIINIFAASYSNRTSSERSLNIFTYNPFGTFKVINITSSADYGDFFLRQNSNFQQYPIKFELSRLLVHSDDELWTAVLHVMNATYERVAITSITGIDVLPVLNSLNGPAIVTIYPMLSETGVILVPESLPYSEFSTYLQTITTDSFFSYFLMTIGAVILLLSVTRYITHKKVLFFQSVADVLNLLMNDNGSIKYGLLFRTEVFLIVPLTFVGLVFVNGILSVLQSYLTRPILQPQVNTIEGIYESPFLIFAESEYWASTTKQVLTNRSQHTNWGDKIRIMKQDLIVKEIVAMNTSISFLIDMTTAKNLLRVQKKLNLKGYHIAQTHIYKLMMYYIVERSFPFIERFNEIIHWIRSAGLYEKWALQDDIVMEDRIRIFHNKTKIYDANDIVSFPLPFYLAYGYLVSVIVFMIEIIWNKLTLTKRFQKVFSPNFQHLRDLNILNRPTIVIVDEF